MSDGEELPIEIDAENIRMMIADPLFSECMICAICAIYSGATWPQSVTKDQIETGQCPGCGRETGLVKIKDWKFKERSA